MDIPSSHCAREVLATIPAVMQAIRREMRLQRKAGITVPQFRAMAFALHNPGTSLAETAEHVGVTPSAMSKLVDALVEEGLMLRETSKDDRRRLVLHLAPTGKSMLHSMQSATQEKLSGILEELSDADRVVIVQAMQALGSVFGTISDMREPAQRNGVR